MKIDIDLTALQESVRKMGIPPPEEDMQTKSSPTSHKTKFKWVENIKDFFIRKPTTNKKSSSE